MLTLIFSSLMALAAEKVVIVGDSHSCGSFGSQLTQDLAAKGAYVELYCAVSSSPVHWVNGTNPTGMLCQWLTSKNLSLKKCRITGAMHTMKQILAAQAWSKVVIALGNNTMINPTADANYKKLADKVTDEMLKCFWVGPPVMRPDQAKGFPVSSLTKMNNNLKTFYSSLPKNCTVIDSRPVTSLGKAGAATFDGVHRTTSAGRAWADAVAPMVN